MPKRFLSCTIKFLFFFLIAVQSTSASAQKPSKTPVVLPGAYRMDIYLPLLQGKSVAVFANQTSMIGKSHLVDSLLKHNIRVTKIFAPEHGFRGNADAGESVNSQKDPKTGIQIISLYGSKLKPSAADLEDVDIMIFDIQDVGVRFYTYISSLQKYIESAIENNRPLIIFDRPNPNGFYVDGPVLDPGFKSFVGMQPVPVVYGMTIGEYAKLLIGEKWLDPSIGADLSIIHAINDAERKIDSLIRKQHMQAVNFDLTDFQLLVIPCLNYTHKSRYALPVAPSPNLPVMQAVWLYPSLCFLEGTVISLGRGTGKPFQQFGNPNFPASSYHFTPRSTAGAKNPPLLNQTCNGFDLSRLDLTKNENKGLQLKWLLKAYALYPKKDEFFLSSGFFNKLAGNSLLMQQIRDGKSEKEIRESWEPGIKAFKVVRKKYLMYPDFE